MNPIEYLVRADEFRRTRLHDMKGHRLPTSRLAEVPVAFCSAAARLMFNYRPQVPWIPPAATTALARVIQKDWKVLEFGSGMSTLWLARRCQSVVSIEHDPAWHASLSQQLTALGLSSAVHYELRDEARYADLSAYPDEFFDLCVVDGADRATCVRNAVSRIKPGGFLYWDNSDNLDQQAREAEPFILDWIRRRGGSYEYFLGFPPTTCHVTEGMLVRLPPSDISHT